ncbi:metal ABC transporter permease [Polyangium jinanense]|uniref:Metal ABC transporter permease n=1 Tax=Polyangium jinanense TaxID=2829994 RepID=A0A9X4AU91_9BACT|nr:metal ABC transporter permease [Polyangium jinanense]MDC3956163.1 metal ABC transporter permease [Polyangium jinanense]MDC3983002.1 metal ABC transporter permease [Polyangium jinanense]
MNALLEPLQVAFMQRAMIAGAVVGGLCAMIGVFVVQRGLSFIGDGLAHAAFGGIALGLLLGVSLERMTWVALPFTVLIALGIGYVLRRGNLRGDVATGVFSAVSFALGVLLLGLRSTDGPQVNVETVLFGSILAISPDDLITVGVVGVVTSLLMAFTWTKLAYATFDPELAALSGVKVAALDYMLLALTAVVIVVAVKTVGIALVSSFVVIPAATAKMVGRSIGRVALLAIAIGVIGSSIGLMLSYHADVASGATIILTLGAVFGLSLLFRKK